jgi:hypothetical protein
LGFYLTLSAKNQFQFTCPVFNAETKMSACMALREAVWMGKHVEKRLGCQAAMNCGMCPAATIVSRINYAKEAVSDDYGSIEPKKGKLHANILQRIVNVIPRMKELERIGVSETERELMLTARSRIEAQLKTAPDANGKANFIEPRRIQNDKPISSRIAAKPAAVKTKNEAINQAARTGDMSAAINAAQAA